MKQQMKEEDLYKDRDSQIAAIQGTFDRAKDPVSIRLLCFSLCFVSAVKSVEKQVNGNGLLSQMVKHLLHNVICS